MIITKLMGGMGNQMFQYACGKGLAAKLDTNHFLDDRFFDNQVGVTQRHFCFHKFPNAKANILDTNNRDFIIESQKPIVVLSDIDRKSVV